MRASAERVRESRNRAAEMLGATPEVQEWETAVLHRAHRVGDGACARVTWTRTDPGNLDRVVERPPGEPHAVGGDPGFRSSGLMVDRRSGRCAGAVVFDSREAIGGHAGPVHDPARGVHAADGDEILEVAEFDPTLADLRVPETV